MNPRVMLRDLACERGGRLLFQALSLELAAGHAALVTGPNGAGKSSLLRVIAGLLDPAAGTAEVDGRLALADERPALDWDRTLASALAFWRRVDGGERDGLEAFALDHLADVPVRMLSTGQRKRAVLARTVASGADIWLLDEPANGLDDASLDMLATAMAAHREAGGIIIAASHQPLGLPGGQMVVLG